jgi:serine/threonine protein kinase
VWTQILDQDGLYGRQANGKPMLIDSHSKKFLSALQISRVQTIHEKNLIYCDIKPDDFLIGRPGTEGANSSFHTRKVFNHLRHELSQLFTWWILVWRSNIVTRRQSNIFHTGNERV